MNSHKIFLTSHVDCTWKPIKCPSIDLNTRSFLSFFWLIMRFTFNGVAHVNTKIKQHYQNNWEIWRLFVYLFSFFVRRYLRKLLNHRHRIQFRNLPLKNFSCFYFSAISRPLCFFSHSNHGFAQRTVRWKKQSKYQQGDKNPRVTRRWHGHFH